MKTDEEIAKQIADECSHGDQEGAHYDADMILIGLLRSLGFNKTADAWEALDKWYA